MIKKSIIFGLLFIYIFFLELQASLFPRANKKDLRFFVEFCLYQGDFLLRLSFFLLLFFGLFCFVGFKG